MTRMARWHGHFPDEPKIVKEILNLDSRVVELMCPHMMLLFSIVHHSLANRALHSCSFCYAHCPSLQPRRFQPEDPAG
jgi:hypothetical protein